MKVSFLVPVRDGERWLEDALRAIDAQRAPGLALEIVAVEDGSADGSPRMLARWASRGIRVVPGPRRGAAAALNEGLRAVSGEVVCQVDQDVILQRGWLAPLLAALHGDEKVAAIQGIYEPAPGDTLWARVAGLDLLQRYDDLRGEDTDHVCTGNTAYRTEALRAVGGFDEALGYGYDNDLSYRLGAAGWRLRLCRSARAVHRWRQDARGYLRQQYGQGYGRLDVIARHPLRFSGDRVSGPGMILHAAAMSVSLPLLATAPLPTALAGAGIVGALAAERAVAGVRAWRRFGDPAALAFPAAHLLRDVAWATAAAAWALRRLARRPAKPSHSMLAARPHRPGASEAAPGGAPKVGP